MLVFILYLLKVKFLRENCLLFPGYDLNQVNLYINKLFENVGSITFEEVEEEERCKFLITGVTSCLGERLDFNQVSSCSNV